MAPLEFEIEPEKLEAGFVSGQKSRGKVFCVVSGCAFLVVAIVFAIWHRLWGSVAPHAQPHVQPPLPPCLCLFDIDRTLTANQKWVRTPECAGTSDVPNIEDAGYKGGKLVLSDLAGHLDETFCKRCYRGIITRGDATGNEERTFLLELLGGTDKTGTDVWQDFKLDENIKAESSLTYHVPDGFKHLAAASIVDWWHREKNIVFRNKDVYFFDDRADNIQSFEKTGMNAQQISCSSRDPMSYYDGPVFQIGDCGGSSLEVETPTQGINLCPPPCLCLFDIDRTLTTNQKWFGQTHCGGAHDVPGIEDTGYKGGKLVVSDLADNLEETFCRLCYRGIITAGDASGVQEREYLLDLLGGTDKTGTDVWQDFEQNENVKAESSLTMKVPNKFKHLAAASIVDWWQREKKIVFRRKDVYFFDDRAENVQAFENSGMNAQQISCSSRDPDSYNDDPGFVIGDCGGLASEVSRKGIINLCKP